MVIVKKSRSHQLLSTQLPEPIEKISALYGFSMLGQDRIAGKDTLIVAIKPNDHYRFDYQLWIDSQSYLLLKYELKDSSGATLEQIMFTKLDVLENIPDELLKASNSDDGYKWYNSAVHKPSKQAFISQWSVKWMLNGFNMSNYDNQSIVSSDSSVEHMIYTDYSYGFSFC